VCVSRRLLLRVLHPPSLPCPPFHFDFLLSTSMHRRQQEILKQVRPSHPVNHQASSRLASTRLLFDPPLPTNDTLGLTKLGAIKERKGRLYQQQQHRHYQQRQRRLARKPVRHAASTHSFPHSNSKLASTLVFSQTLHTSKHSIELY
jgi:hypothetical protein